jgi:hypothetical protein
MSRLRRKIGDRRRHILAANTKQVLQFGEPFSDPTHGPFLLREKRLGSFLAEDTNLRPSKKSPGKRWPLTLSLLDLDLARNMERVESPNYPSGLKVHPVGRFSSSAEVAEWLNEHPKYWGQVIHWLKEYPEMVEEVSEKIRNKKIRKRIRDLESELLSIRKGRVLTSLAKSESSTGFTEAWRALNSSRCEIRSSAAASLVYLSTRPKFKRMEREIVHRLEDYLSNEKSAYARAAVITTMGRSQNPLFASMIFNTLKREKGPYLQSHCMEALRGMPELRWSPSLEETVRKKLTFRHKDVRGQALLLMVSFTRGGIPTAEKFLESKGEIDRQYGVRALAIALKKYPELRSRIKRTVAKAHEDKIAVFAQQAQRSGVSLESYLGSRIYKDYYWKELRLLYDEVK